MNELEALRDCLLDGTGREILVDPEVGKQAMVPLRRMLDFPRP